MGKGNGKGGKDGGLDCQQISIIVNCIFIMVFGLLLFLNFTTGYAPPGYVSTSQYFVGIGAMCVGLVGIIGVVIKMKLLMYILIIGALLLLLYAIAVMVMLIDYGMRGPVGTWDYIRCAILILLMASTGYSGYQFLERC